MTFVYSITRWTWPICRVIWNRTFWTNSQASQNARFGKRASFSPNRIFSSQLWTPILGVFFFTALPVLVGKKNCDTVLLGVFLSC